MKNSGVKLRKAKGRGKSRPSMIEESVILSNGLEFFRAVRAWAAPRVPSTVKPGGVLTAISVLFLALFPAFTGIGTAMLGAGFLLVILDLYLHFK